MPITLTLDRQLTSNLRKVAQDLNKSPETIAVQAIKQFVRQEAVDNLENTLVFKNGGDEKSDLEFKKLVAKIRAIPPNPAMITLPKGTVAETLSKLENLPKEPEFDLLLWTQQWEAIEAEMKAVTKANTLAESHF